MTVFGRDTIITCLQTMLPGPTSPALRSTCSRRCRRRRTTRRSTPSPGRSHEIRTGKAAKHWFAAYYGTVDATPLYLVLLSEVWRGRTTRSSCGVCASRRCSPCGGSTSGATATETGSSSTRSDRTGSDNQSWKDSGDSQLFSDGRMAEPPITPAEVQGYVYDAKRRTAELARAVWRDRALADRLTREADELRDRFDEAFWVDARGGYFALALDRDKKKVDSMTSNMGHLLWSGSPPDRVDGVVDAMMSDALWSGWGVRTMSQEDGLQPAQLPQRHGLASRQLADRVRARALQPLARGAADRAADAQRGSALRLPAAGGVRGLRREETSFPIAYPTAARPQAWAAGAPVLLLQTLLGLQPDHRRHALESVAPDELPSWAQSLRLQGVQAFDGMWDVRLEDGHVRVDRHELGLACGSRSSRRRGSLCLRPATAGSSGSCRCSPTGSPRRGTT